MARLVRDTEGKEDQWEVDLMPHSRLSNCFNVSLSISSPKSNEGEFILQMHRHEVEELIADLAGML